MMTELKPCPLEGGPTIVARNKLVALKLVHELVSKCPHRHTTADDGLEDAAMELIKHCKFRDVPGNEGPDHIEILIAPVYHRDLIEALEKKEEDNERRAKEE